MSGKTTSIVKMSVFGLCLFGTIAMAEKVDESKIDISNNISTENLQNEEVFTKEILEIDRDIINSNIYINDKGETLIEEELIDESTEEELLDEKEVIDKIESENEKEAEKAEEAEETEEIEEVEESVEKSKEKPKEKTKEDKEYTKPNGVTVNLGYWYRIRSITEDKIVSVQSNTATNYENVVPLACSYVPNQNWIIEQSNDKQYYVIKVMHSGQVLNVESSNENGANVNQTYYMNEPNQHWKIEKTSDGYYKIISVYNNKALTISNNNICVRDSNNNANQKWIFEEVY